MSIPQFPSEIKSYKVFVARSFATIELEGDVEILGHFRFFFGNKKGGEFIDRGGRLNVSRPMVMFSGVLDLLRNEKPIFLHGSGSLSTKAEFVGEGES